MVEHDFKAFPELRNNQMDTLYFSSPHKQIFEDFDATVVKVHDGDTVTLRADFRDFDFPLRFLGTNAKELSEGGEDAKNYLERILLNEDVHIVMSPERVEKWGRLLGTVEHMGLNMSDAMIRAARSRTETRVRYQTLI